MTLTSLSLTTVLSQSSFRFSFIFSFNNTATTEIYTLSLHDALPIWKFPDPILNLSWAYTDRKNPSLSEVAKEINGKALADIDRKSTRLNSSHEWISYAVFCLKKKKKKENGIVKLLQQVLERVV